ncbi:hypothetical protein [Kitasatospora sp. NPDC090308]|uniref:hypothetical protein n=1 Tax=Kitasatospora sp. NPDC090308 TaxID=3364082 RepID=UPI00382F6571
MTGARENSSNSPSPTHPGKALPRSSTPPPHACAPTTVDLALSWTGRGGIRCYANSRRTGSGTHLTGFHDGLRAALLPHMGEHALRAVLAELTAVVSVKLDDPHYEGSTREVLGNHPVRARVAETVRRAVEAWLVEHPRTFG